MRLFAFLAISLAALFASGQVSAQGSVDRCLAAKALLTEERATLSQTEIQYFTQMLESEECRKAQTARPNAKPGRPAPTPAKPAQPRLALPSGPFSIAQCNDASQGLTGMQTAAERNSDRATILMHILSSSNCSAYRTQRARALSADPGIASMTAKLKDNGIDIEARMPAQNEKCREKVTRQLAAGESGNRRQMEEACVATARQMVYSAAILELDERNDARYAREVAEHKAEVARIEGVRRENERKAAAEKAAYEKSMAEWRRAVKLCREGKKEYCQQPQN